MNYSVVNKTHVIKIQKYPGKQMGGSPQFLNWPRTDHQTNTQKDFLHMYWRLMDRVEAIVDRIPD